MKTTLMQMSSPTMRECGQLWVATMVSALAGVVAITDEIEPDYVQANWDNTESALAVHRLAVDPGFRGVGVAKVLLQQAERVAAARGISLIRVDTNVENKATQRLFPLWVSLCRGDLTQDTSRSAVL